MGDVVRLRKDHPCGGTDWEVVRLGADIGLRCLKCNHRILLPRSQFERRLKTFVSHASTAEDDFGDGHLTTDSAETAPSE